MPLLVTACAGTSPERPVRQAVPESTSPAVRVDLDGKLPVLGDPTLSSPLVTSRLSASVDDDRLRYQAGWAVKPGEIVAQRDPGAPATLARLGSQRLGQDVSLKLPAPGGSPLTLGLSTEWGSEWLLAGHRRFRSEQAALEWAPGPARMGLEAGTARPFAAGTALACDLRSTVRLPTGRPGPARPDGLTFSGAACSVTADGEAYAGMEARAWAFGYAWDRSQRRTEAALSIIDAAEESGAYQNLPPGFEFAVTHSREMGAFRAESRVALREAPAWEPATGAYVLDLEPSVSARTAISWDLSQASLSANWATGMDRLWFTPAPENPGERLGLALNLSRWLGRVVPGTAPEFAMNWNWSQVRAHSHEDGHELGHEQGRETTAEQTFRLDLTLNF